MGRSPNLKIIEQELSRLSLRSQRKLVARLNQRLREKHTKRKQCDWAKLYGLGKGIWGQVDAQVYVNRLREDRV